MVSSFLCIILYLNLRYVYCLLGMFMLVIWVCY